MKNVFSILSVIILLTNSNYCQSIDSLIFYSIDESIKRDFLYYESCKNYSVKPVYLVKIDQMDGNKAWALTITCIFDYELNSLAHNMSNYNVKFLVDKNQFYIAFNDSIIGSFFNNCHVFFSKDSIPESFHTPHSLLCQNPKTIFAQFSFLDSLSYSNSIYGFIHPNSFKEPFIDVHSKTFFVYKNLPRYFLNASIFINNYSLQNQKGFEYYDSILHEIKELASECLQNYEQNGFFKTFFYPRQYVFYEHYFMKINY